MKQTTHPNFILGIVCLFLLAISVIMRQNNFGAGDFLLITAIILGAIHWLWAIIDLFKNQYLTSESRVLWGILIFAIPPVGGILYYAMSKTVKM